jgi:hypothetical protein
MLPISQRPWENARYPIRSAWRRSVPENPPEVEALFPEGFGPENRLPNVSSLCSYGTRPHAMTGFLRQVLMEHFASVTNIEDQIIRRKLEETGVWKPSENGENESGIIIESITKWLPNTESQRPALVIKRNAWQWERVLPGDSDGDTYEQGHRFYFGFWSGSHTIFVLGQNGGEVELLATEVGRFMLRYASEFVEMMNLHRFVPVGVDTLHQLKEVADHYVVPVTVAYRAEEYWRLEPHAPRLKRMKFRASDMF